MAVLVGLDAVSISFGVRTILAEVSCGIQTGERIGVVGRNGDGKSTLVRLLVGQQRPDSGRVTVGGGVRIGYLPQTIALPAGRSVRDVLVAGRAEHEFAGDARRREVMSALLGGIEAPILTGGLDTVVDSLSGGEARRVALADLLARPLDLLVADEPTNHLDLEVIAWLGAHLAERKEALLIASHDRWLLDAATDQTWEVGEQTVRSYEGGYAAYVLARAERERQRDVSEARRANLVRKELAWLRRGAPARTSKPKFRIEAANALIAAEPEVRNRSELVRFASARLGKTVVDLKDVSVSLGGRELYSHLTRRIGPGDRIGIVGANGSGKTTLLRLITGELAPDQGVVKIGQTVHAAYLSQHVDELDPTLRALEAIEEVANRVDLGGRELTASQLAEQFGFTGPLQWTPVGDLSGGQRRRLQMLRLLLTGPNLLLLDEPTNDLDIDTLTALEDLLDGFAGTLIVVSHDRYFLERVCDRIEFLRGDGGIELLPGGLDQYLAERAQQVQQAGQRPAAPGATGGQDVPTSVGNARAARKNLQRLERQLDRLTERERQLSEQMAAAATDFSLLSELDAEHRAVRAELAATEEEWLAAAESVPPK